MSLADNIFIEMCNDEEEETEETEAEDKDTTAKKKENLKTVGEKKDGCIAFKLRNATSKKIIGLAIKTADETEFPENMMEADDVFELKEKKRVYFSKENSEAETAEAIKSIYYNTGYVIDTHTAVAASVYKKYVAETSDETKTVIASTASPFKFTRSVMDAIDKAKYDKMTDFELVDELSRIANVAVPQAIEDIRTAPVLHDRVCDKTEMKAVVKDILGIK